MPHQALKLLSRVKGAPVLACGDLMLDRYIYGSATRLSPEAPVPVIQVRSRSFMPGGMGNVVMNLSALGASPRALGLVGGDARASVLAGLLGPLAEDGSFVLIRDPSRPTTVKTRVIAGIQQVVRYDEESLDEASGEIVSEYKGWFGKMLPGSKSLCLSDYGKGLLTPSLTEWLIAEAARLSVPVVVDPKGSDWSPYRGAALVTPNRQELSVALGRDVSRAGGDFLAEGAKELISRWGLKNILVTRSEDGMTLVSDNGSVFHLPTRARAVYDVSGAGDTVAAAMAAAMAAGAPLSEGAVLASLAAGVVVGKVGTSSATPEEIRESVELGDAARDGKEP
jgi:D-beta-D-heptose 7-phosphate kinase/D-beta-D-heptose 1-phosphate adenosyltransferase